MIRTDWRGRAVQGPWYGDYYLPWADAHDRARRGDLRPGCWCDDKHGRTWWVTDTPEWDRQWFLEQGVKPPRYWGDPDRTRWVEDSPGLQFQGYVPSRWWRWGRRKAAD